MDSLNEDGRKSLSYDDILKNERNAKNYQDAMEATLAFNKRLNKDRKMRVPFLDSQTRVTQTYNTFSVSDYQRKTLENSENNYVYEYPIKRWIKKRRLNIDPYDPSVFPGVPIKTDENNNLTDTVGLLLQQQAASNQSLNQILKNEPEHEEIQANNVVNTSVVFQDDSFENEDNDDSDDNDYEDTKRKRRRNAKQRKKADSTPIGDDKPYACDRCGMKYKTKPGLTYHIQKSHSSQASLIHTNSGLINQNSVKSDSMNQDENTNSMLGFDDTMNSTTSLHHVQINTNNNMSLPQQQYHYHYP